MNKSAKVIRYAEYMAISVAVIFGGQSSEHAVSCVSAANVIAHLDTEKYFVIPIGITQSGSWVKVDSHDLVADFHSGLPSVNDLQGLNSIRLASRYEDIYDRNDSSVVVDVAIPMMHGRWGEDGAIQGLLEMMNIPYVGSKLLGSAVCMDKGVTKRLLREAGIAVGQFQEFDLSWKECDVEQIMKSIEMCGWDFSSPLYVKPTRSGSSMGVSRVCTQSDLLLAITHAMDYDSKIIIEKEILGREIEVAVLEYPDGSIIASTPSEIIMPASSPMYDFQAKYENDTAVVDVPARISDQEKELCQQLALQAFRVLDCHGLARVDFFMSSTEIIVNEINTMPGFTPISAYPRMFAYDGIAYGQLLDTLIATACDTHHVTSKRVEKLH